MGAAATRRFGRRVYAGSQRPRSVSSRMPKWPLTVWPDTPQSRAMLAKFTQVAIRGGEAAKLVADRPAAEKVGGAAPHLACAGAAQGESDLPALVEPVHLVEQGRHLLHFVDDDLCGPGPRGQFLAQYLGSLEIPAILIGLEQIDPDGVGVRLVEQGRLVGLPGPLQEERLEASCREAQRSREHTLHFIMIK